MLLRIMFSSCTGQTNAINNTIKDVDGNVYHTLTIGTQTWMVENLKTTKYRNGDQIPNVTDNAAWSNHTTGAYCNYNNDATTGNKYGKLYNSSAVRDSRNLAPIGWHVANDADWKKLVYYVAAYLGTSGSIAKALASTTDWVSSNDAGAVGNDLTKNNTTGFSALPAGNRSNNGSFNDVGYYGYWWGTEKSAISVGWTRAPYGPLAA